MDHQHLFWKKLYFEENSCIFEKKTATSEKWNTLLPLTFRFVQFIESTAIADVLQEDGSIQNFLRKHQPNEKDPYGIDKEAMDNYVKVST